jgi:hypothetical protein
VCRDHQGAALREEVVLPEMPEQEAQGPPASQAEREARKEKESAIGAGVVLKNWSAESASCLQNSRN